MAREGEEAQVILLGGILLVIAFILFSTQLALLANLGQQTGRESETPLLEDYFAVRQGVQGYLKDEMRDSNGVVRCPGDLTAFAIKYEAQSEYLSLLQSTRGTEFRSQVLSKALVPSGPNFNLNFKVRLSLAYGPTSIADEVTFIVPCAP